MVALAGRLQGLMPMLRSVPVSTAAGGLTASGLSVLGNVASGEIDKKPGNRILAEAIAAGGLGALAGRHMGKNVLASRDVLEDARHGQRAKIALEINNPSVHKRMTEDLNRTIRQQDIGVNTGAGIGVGIGLLGAGGLGGLVGGGAANIAQVPQTQIHDADPQIEQYLAAIQASDPMTVGA